MNLTEQELQEMEARANAATPGPWLTERHSFSNFVSIKTPDGIGVVICTIEPENSACATGKEKADTIFVAHSRADIPRLIATVREQQAEIDRLKEEQTHYDARIRGAQQVVDYFRTENERIRKDITEFLDVFEQEPEEASITPLLLFARQGGQA